MAGNPGAPVHVEAFVNETLQTSEPALDHFTPPWMDQAQCRSLTPTDFFPSDGVGVEVAKRVCSECPVKSECLDYALTHRIDHGVWGGCSERERRRILRSRRVGAF